MIKTCESSKEQLTHQLTPKSQKQGEIDTQNLPPGLTVSAERIQYILYQLLCKEKHCLSKPKYIE